MMRIEDVKALETPGEDELAETQEYPLEPYPRSESNRAPGLEHVLQYLQRDDARTAVRGQIHCRRSGRGRSTERQKMLRSPLSLLMLALTFAFASQLQPTPVQAAPIIPFRLAPWGQMTVILSNAPGRSLPSSTLIPSMNTVTSALGIPSYSTQGPLTFTPAITYPGPNIMTAASTPDQAANGNMQGTATLTGAPQTSSNGDATAPAVVSAKGTTTLTGLFQWSSNHTMDYTTSAITNGNFTVTDSQGDKIYGVYTGSFAQNGSFQLNYTMKGGAGQFAGITGTGVITGTSSGTSFQASIF